MAKVYHYPRAGTRQGVPLSPALFSLVAYFVVFPLQDLDPGLTIMMYANDLIIFLDGRANPQLLGKVWKVVSRFGHFFGIEDKLEQNGCNSPQLWRTELGLGTRNPRFVACPPPPSFPRTRESESERERERETRRASVRD